MLANHPKEEQVKKNKEIHNPISFNISLRKNPLRNHYLQIEVLLLGNPDQSQPHRLSPLKIHRKKLHLSHKSKCSKKVLFLVLKALNKEESLKSADVLWRKTKGEGKKTFEAHYLLLKS